MYGIIYYAHNLVSRKGYVGQTTKNLKERKSEHFSAIQTSRDNFYFHNALRKYKEIDWEWKVLGYADCQFGLDTLEKSWIWMKDSMAPDGYNTKEGGSRGKHGVRTRVRTKDKGAKNPRAKAVICIETSEIYGAIHEAVRKTGINLGNISEVLNGKRKTAGGFHWKFV